MADTAKEIVADPVYRCTGCGRLTNSPETDLRDIRERGGISCCPERDMRPMSSIDILMALSEARLGLSDATKALEDISSPSQTLGLLWWQVRARETLAAIRARSTHA